MLLVVKDWLLRYYLKTHCITHSAAALLWVCGYLSAKYHGLGLFSGRSWDSCQIVKASGLF